MVVGYMVADSLDISNNFNNFIIVCCFGFIMAPNWSHKVQFKTLLLRIQVWYVKACVYFEFRKSISIIMFYYLWLMWYGMYNLQKWSRIFEYNAFLSFKRK